MPGLQKALYIAPDWESLRKKTDDLNVDKYSLPQLLKSEPGVYKKVLQSKQEGDEERFYLMSMRYCMLVSHIGKKFGQKNVKDLLKNYRECIEYVDDLSIKLQKRYEAISIKERPAICPAPSPPVKSLSADPQPAGEKGDILNGDSGYQFITTKQLYDWLRCHVGASGVKKSVLIVDVRPAKDYEKSHLKSDCSISCHEEIIEKGKAASHYGNNIRPQFKKLWDQRKLVDYLVLMDWSSTSPDIQEGSPLEIFKRTLDKWDIGPKYVSCTYILDGGFEQWNLTYPSLSTSRVEAPSKDPADDSLDINNINFPDINEGSNDGSHSSGVIGNGGQSGFYNLSSENQLPPFLSKPPHVDRSSKANAELRYQKNKEDQLQLEKDIDNSKNMLNNVEHKLLDNHTKELLDRKKVLEEKVIELQKEHQKKDDENERLHREIEELRQRERVAAARQAPKPGITPMTLTDEATNLLNTISPDAKEAEEKLSSQDVSKHDAANDDLSTVSLKQDTDSFMLRSHSTPNIAQTPAQDLQKPPTYDRSTKPAPQSYGYGSTFRVNGSGRSGLTGLKNLGNTCYMNSIIQCISNTPKLVEYFCYGKYQNDVNESRTNPTGGEVARKLAWVIRELWSGEYKSTGCENLKRTVGRHVDSFAGTSQQDSHEFFTFLIDWLHKDLCRECLRLYTTGELISGYRCESCEQTNDATKKVDLWRLPQILVIHLKRFYSDGFYHKRQTLVDFELKGLDLKSFTSNPESSNTKYDLYAVSNHFGTLEGGHYTALCRNKDKWYKFDDQDVTEISPGYVKSPNAYILFYELTS